MQKSWLCAVAAAAFVGIGAEGEARAGLFDLVPTFNVAVSASDPSIIELTPSLPTARFPAAPIAGVVFKLYSGSTEAATLQLLPDTAPGPNDGWDPSKIRVKRTSAAASRQGAFLVHMTAPATPSKIGLRAIDLPALLFLNPVQVANRTLTITPASGTFGAMQGAGKVLIGTTEATNLRGERQILADAPSLGGAFLVSVEAPNGTFPKRAVTVDPISLVGSVVGPLLPIFSVSSNPATPDTFRLATATGSSFGNRTANSKVYAVPVASLPSGGSVFSLTSLPSAAVELVVNSWSTSAIEAKLPRTAPPAALYAFVVKTDVGFGVSTSRLNLDIICAEVANLNSWVQQKFAIKNLTTVTPVPGDAIDVFAAFGSAHAPRVTLLPHGGANIGVEWKLTDDAAGQTPTNPTTYDLKAGATSGTAGARQSLTFLPAFDSAKDRYLWVTIKVTAPGCTLPVTLPPLKVTQPLLKLPGLVIGSRFKNFGLDHPKNEERAALLWTNAGTDDRNALLNQFNSIFETSRKLISIAQFASWAAGLESANKLLGQVPTKNILPKSAVSVHDLGTWWPLIESWPAHVNAEDIIASLLVIGVPGQRVGFCNNKNFKKDQGALEVTVGPLGFVMIRDLMTNRPQAVGGSVRVIAEPKGGYWITSQVTWPHGQHDITGFGGEFSSAKFLSGSEQACDG